MSNDRVPPAASPNPTCVLKDVQLGRDVQYWGFVNLYGCTIGDETKIGTFVEIQKGARVGARCKISSHTFICEGVEIEDEVFVGHGVRFINDRYPRATADGALQTEADWEVVPTRVERGASLGSGAVILCGVTIGAGAIVGAGATVTRDVPPGATVAGNPARLLPAKPSADEPVRQVPAFDLARQAAALKPQALAAIGRVIDGCGFALGPEAEAFEREFAETCEAAHAVVVNSGTSALHLALLAAGVGPGDEVLTTPLSFIATSWAISYCGATPVFVDVDPATCCLDPAQVEARLSPRTKAVLPVHLYGQAADLGPLLELCAARGIPLIEDAAQAHGARYQGRTVGGLGLAGCFSFYPSKNLGSWGEGGCVVTNDPLVADRVRSLRDHAQATRGVHERLGFNHRMTGFQAAVLRVKLPHLARWNARRRAIAQRYLAELADLPELTLPIEAPGREHVWHQFVVRHPQRDAVRRRLADAGVGTGVHYATPIHRQPAYAGLGLASGSLPHAEAACDEVFSLPMFPELTGAEVDFVIARVRECLS